MKAFSRLYHGITNVELCSPPQYTYITIHQLIFCRTDDILLHIDINQTFPRMKRCKELILLANKGMAKLLLLKFESRNKNEKLLILEE